MNIALFYRYYLKRLFKSWFFWVYLILTLLLVFGFPYLLYKTNSQHLSKEYGVTNYKDFLKCISGLKVFHSEYGSTKYYPLPWGTFTPVFKDFALAGGSSYKDILTAVWKLTCSGLIGNLIANLLVTPAVSLLVSRSQNSGDDETALTLVSPIKRDDLIIGKLLAFLTWFLASILITFIIPYTFYYCWLVETISWPVILTFLVGSLIFALPIFLLFYAVLFLLDSLSTWLRWGFSFLIGLAPMLWLITKFNWLREKEKVIENLSKFGANFWIIIPLALVLGGLFLFLYRERFRKKDF